VFGSEHLIASPHERLNCSGEDQPPPAAPIGRASPKIRSMTATGFLILAPSLASTRREEPHREHRSSRGKLSALTMPTWPHVQETLSIMVSPGGWR